jgi:hypothetical protein
MNEKKGITLTRKQLTIGGIIVLLLIIAAVTVGLNWNHWFGSNTADTAQTESFTPDLDPGATDWTDGTLSDESEGEAVGIKIPGYPSITIPANTENVTVSLLNPEGNPCYLTFELVLSDTGETLYTSKMVAPGQVVSDITLSRSLDAGEYNATIKITTASLTDGTAMNGANVETILIVQ